MKIVHFAKFYPPEYGGIESVTEALAVDHAAAGHDIEVVCFTRGNSSTCQSNNVKLHRVKVQKQIVSQPLAKSYLDVCASAARNADLVHVHTPNVLAALALLRLPRHIHVVIHWHADIQNKGTLGLIVRPVERAMLRRADVVVPTTEAYANSSKALTGFRNKISVIPIGIADNAKAPTFDIATPPYVLFVGRLVAYKGLSVLLDAVSVTRCKVEVRIVGIGPLLAELQDQARRLGISHRVTFLGNVKDDELQRLMQDAALFCLPSIDRLEAFGVVLLEAMRSGRAIISSNIPGSGVPWVNSMGVNVPVGDPTALAEAIDRLVADPERTRKLGHLSRSRFLEDFSREVMSQRFLDLYKDILGKD